MCINFATSGKNWSLGKKLSLGTFFEEERGRWKKIVPFGTWIVGIIFCVFFWRPNNNNNSNKCAAKTGDGIGVVVVVVTAPKYQRKTEQKQHSTTV